jgi:hypothetical protein
MANPVQFAGRFNAAEFAYGVNKTVAALQVINGPNATGSGTLTLAFGTCVTQDGKSFNPLNTNAPITVGGNSSQETITPSAVSASTPLQYSTTTLTGSFTYLHGNGDQVRSGTCGLQEALNVCSAYGGGLVVIDAGWTALGGTQAMIEAATIPANVSIEDLRFGQSGGLTAQFTLTNAQVLGMEATPVELLPAPGTNSVYVINKATLVNLNTGTAYANGGAITIGYGTTAATNALSGTVAATFLTSPTATEIITVAGGVTSATAGTSLLNEPIYITNATAPFITGTGTLQIQLEYSLITT